MCRHQVKLHEHAVEPLHMIVHLTERGRCAHTFCACAETAWITGLVLFEDEEAVMREAHGFSCGRGLTRKAARMARPGAASQHRRCAQRQGLHAVPAPTSMSIDLGCQDREFAATEEAAGALAPKELEKTALESAG